MPFYDVRNNDTGEITEMKRGINEMSEFIKDNPQYQIVITAGQSLVDPTKLTATRKVDGGWNEVLTRIHKRTPGSMLNQTANIRGI